MLNILCKVVVAQDVVNVNEMIASKLLGMDVIRQIENDRLMIKPDGAANKEKLGANEVLGISKSVTRAVAMDRGGTDAERTRR